MTSSHVTWDQSVRREVDVLLRVRTARWPEPVDHDCRRSDVDRRAPAIDAAPRLVRAA